MLPTRNTPRCQPSTRWPLTTPTPPRWGAWALLLAVLGHAAAGVALGGAGGATAGQVPGPETTMQAYRTIEPWIRAWSVPTEPTVFPPAGAEPAGDAGGDGLGLGALLAAREPVAGAAVTLRLSGRVIGRGRAFDEDGHALWRAARLAWQEADAALPIPRDAVRDRRAREMAERITIELEVAGQLLPVVDPNFESLDWRATPGNGGVMIRQGQVTEIAFPNELNLVGKAMGGGLFDLAGVLDPTIEALSDFRSRQIAAYWFSARAVAQLEPGGGPMFLHRNGSLRQTQEVSIASLHEAAAAMASQLLAQRWRGTEPNGLHGEYYAPAARFRTRISPAHEQALVVMALARFARTTGISPDARQRAIEEATALLESLAQVSEEEAEPLANPSNAALIVLAFDELERAGSRAFSSAAAPDAVTSQTLAMRQQAMAMLMTAAEDLDRDPSLLSPVRQSIIACALARSAGGLAGGGAGSGVMEGFDAARCRALAVRLTQRQYLDSDAGSLIAMMPWLLWSSQALDQAVDDADEARGGSSGQASVLIGHGLLEAMRSQLWMTQLTESDVSVDDADLVGGFIFTRARTPLPTWQALRPLIAMASMLGDPQLTPDDDFSPELIRLRRSLRFMMQLQVGRAEAHAYPDPDRCLGGVRRSLWDHTLGPDAAALALIAVCESLDALERWNSIQAAR